MARLRHPNVVRCYSVGRQQGYHYIGMELIEGRLGDEDLDEQIAE